MVGSMGCCCLVAKLCLTLGDPMNCSPSGSFVHGIFQARILKWVAISFSRGSALPRDQTAPPTLASGFFTTEPPGNLEPMLLNFKKNPQNFP